MFTRTMQHPRRPRQLDRRSLVKALCRAVNFPPFHLRWLPFAPYRLFDEGNSNSLRQLRACSAIQEEDLGEKDGLLPRCVRQRQRPVQPPGSSPDSRGIKYDQTAASLARHPAPSSFAWRPRPPSRARRLSNAFVASVARSLPPASIMAPASAACYTLPFAVASDSRGSPTSCSRLTAA